MKNFQNENKVFFILKRVVKLLDCFFNEHFEKYKSKTFLCSISDEFFISKIDSIKKCSFIRIDRELNFISTFNMKHLYHQIFKAFFSHYFKFSWLLYDRPKVFFMYGSTYCFLCIDPPIVFLCID